MKRVREILALSLAAVALGGCESGKRESTGGDQAVGAEESDAARAERAIERDQQEKRGERRPHSEPRRQPVDQPRTTGRP
ncbi:MAG: hypothetical protein ACKVS9_04980 [Phycisphaerae bacterium]